jgi:alpha-galactosidase
MRRCNLTEDEQVTLMSLWTIFRSPLMYGGDLQHPDPFSLSLITNAEALNVTDASTNTAFVVSNATTAIWRSDSATWQQDGVSYFTVHNLRDDQQQVTVTVQQLRGGQKGNSCTVRDIWAQKDIAQAVTNKTFDLRPHASGLYALHSCTQQAASAHSTHTTTTSSE